MALNIEKSKAYVDNKSVTSVLEDSIRTQCYLIMAYFASLISWAPQEWSNCFMRPQFRDRLKFVVWNASVAWKLVVTVHVCENVGMCACVVLYISKSIIKTFSSVWFINGVPTNITSFWNEMEQQRQTVCIITSGKSWELACVSAHVPGWCPSQWTFHYIAKRVFMVPSVHFVLLCA